MKMKNSLLCLALFFFNFSVNGVARGNIRFPGNFTNCKNGTSTNQEQGLKEVSPVANATSEHISSTPKLTLHRPFLSYVPFFNRLSSLGTQLWNRLPVNVVATVTSTKTVFIQVTRQSTYHPICMTSLQPLPPCIEEEDQYPEERSRPLERLVQEISSKIEPSATTPVSHHESTVTPNLTPQPSLDGQEAVINKREPKYLVNHPTPPMPSTSQNAQIVDKPPQPADNPAQGVLSVTHYVTATSTKTVLEKFVDYRATATLLAQNCIPHGNRLPVCETPETADYFGEDLINEWEFPDFRPEYIPLYEPDDGFVPLPVSKPPYTQSESKSIHSELPINENNIFYRTLPQDNPIIINQVFSTKKASTTKLT